MDKCDFHWTMNTTPCSCANSTVNDVGGHAIEIAPDLKTLPHSKGHYCAHLHYKVITRITFFDTAFVALEVKSVMAGMIL